MKIGFINLLKLTWSLLWRTTVFGSTVLIWGYIVSVFLIFGLLKLGYIEIINSYIVNHQTYLKSLIDAQSTLASIISGILLSIIVSPLYYYPFQKINHLTYKTFDVTFCKNNLPPSPMGMFLHFYLLLQAFNLCFFGLFVIANIPVLSDITDLLSIFLSFFVLSRYSVNGYRIHLTTKPNH